MYRFIFQLLYFCTWLAFFALGRLLFHGYHFRKSSDLNWTELVQTFAYGSRLDASFAAYLCLVPFLAVVASCFWRYPFWRKLVWWFTAVLVVALAALQTADLELYQAWGYRLDSTPLQYINSPAEMAASTASAPLMLLILLWLALSALGLYMFWRVLRVFNPLIPLRWGFWGPVTFLMALLLVIGMRGGWQQIPVNQSSVYFSEKPYANHATLNVPWNVMYSLSRNEYDQTNPYLYMPQAEAESRVRRLYTALEPAPRIVKAGKPNVLLIILESYTANLVGALGSKSGATPNLDSLAAEGMLFTRIYSSGDRSEKGLAAILSGYPAQPATSVMKVPRKTEHLPYLSLEFKKAGYHTSYYYGGELAFANLKSYLLNGQFDRYTEKADFPAKEYNSKWGVHDHVLFRKVLGDLKSVPQPFFSTVFTLSSHEPYEIPVKAFFTGTEEPDLFRNSIRYTDQAVGDFIRQAKKQAWWQNTLVVLVADHGHRFPHDLPIEAPGKFHIPLLFNGGALLQQGRVNKVGSQTDLATTLLRQLSLPDSSFRWGKDLLHPQVPEHAFYVFNDGFGWVTPDTSLAYDNVARIPLGQNRKPSVEHLKDGQAMMQQTFADFLGR